MFEELFTGPIALARQHESPFPEERRQFLRHLKDLGYARSTLHAVEQQVGRETVAQYMY